MKLSDGGPAFPQLSIESGERDGHGDQIDPITASQGGMTMRQWYAGMALHGLVTANMAGREFDISSCLYARSAFALADAMIAAEATP